jgi:HSP20 family protein
MAEVPVTRGTSPAPPARWDPFQAMETMHEQMDRMFEQLLGNGALLGDGGVWSPAVDLEETDDAWIVEADLPGVKKGDVTVELRDNELAIHGEIKERERTGILRRRTRRTGRFDYRVMLPGEIADEAIDAKLDNGVLTVRVPKSERSTPRRIKVK